jgi:hypothetical protein
MSSISLGTGRRRRVRRGGYRSAFLSRHKGKIMTAAKVLGALGVAYAAHKYGTRPKPIFKTETDLGRQLSESVLRRAARSANLPRIVRYEDV